MKLLLFTIFSIFISSSVMTFAYAHTEINIDDYVVDIGWWSEGNIDDSTFAKGIEFMIKEKIIKVPETEKEENKNSSIPKWVRNNASWWASNQISDEDFASGLQYLIKVRIIAV